MKQQTPMMLHEVLLVELIKLNKSISKSDYKQANLSSLRINSLCNAFIPSHNLESGSGKQ